MVDAQPTYYTSFTSWFTVYLKAQVLDAMLSIGRKKIIDMFYIFNFYVIKLQKIRFMCKNVPNNLFMKLGAKMKYL